MDDNQSPNMSEQSGELEKARQRAIDALSPLIGSIDTDPQHKFELGLNVIRLTGNKELVNTTLEAALAIEDVTQKADALVKLVNEINYLQQT